MKFGPFDLHPLSLVPPTIVLLFITHVLAFEWSTENNPSGTVAPPPKKRKKKPFLSRSLLLFRLRGMREVAAQHQGPGEAARRRLHRYHPCPHAPFLSLSLFLSTWRRSGRSRWWQYPGRRRPRCAQQQHEKAPARMASSSPVAATTQLSGWMYVGHLSLSPKLSISSAPLRLRKCACVRTVYDSGVGGSTSCPPSERKLMGAPLVTDSEDFPYIFMSNRNLVVQYAKIGDDDM